MLLNILHYAHDNSKNYGDQQIHLYTIIECYQKIKVYLRSYNFSQLSPCDQFQNSMRCIAIQMDKYLFLILEINKNMQRFLFKIKEISDFQLLKL